MNLQIFSFYITLRMQTSKQTSLFKKSVSKYPGIWGTLLQILSSGALCNISFHCAHDKMTLRENLTIESWETENYMTCRTPPSLFRLFANATHKINHARRNLTFTCKITPRVNFYMFRTLDDFNDQPFHATGIGAILIFEGQDVNCFGVPFCSLIAQAKQIVDVYLKQSPKLT